MSHKEQVTAWLKDAYSMEMGLIPILQNHAGDAKDYPQVRARIEQHVEETRHHAEMVKSRIEGLGENVSAVKTALGGIIGTVQSVATGPFKDELVKNALSDFAAENFEIACYKALVVAAQQTGDQETVRVCQQILQEDEAMARWLDQNLPMVVQETIREKQAEHNK
jgi:ferritin-like metal-binding protein YciE